MSTYIELAVIVPSCFDARFHAQAHRVARAGGDKFLFAGVFVNHRPAGGNRQVGSHIFDQHFLFAAKTAADARFDHPDALDRQARAPGPGCAAHVERHLRAGADHQAVIFVPIGDDDMRLDVRLLHFGDVVFASKDLVGFGETFLHIADIDTDLGRQVDGLDRNPQNSHIQARRAGGERSAAWLLGIEQSRQRLVLDLDQLEACSAISSLSAATNATRSPTKRTLRSREKVSSGPGMGSDCPAVE